MKSLPSANLTCLQVCVWREHVHHPGHSMQCIVLRPCHLPPSLYLSPSFSSCGFGVQLLVLSPLVQIPAAVAIF